jgi:Mg-chelatase subunit ChlD
VAQKVHVGIVLDRSGSMEDCRADAIGAVNSYLRQVKEDRDLEARVSLIIFDSDSIDVIRDRVPAGTCAELGANEYQPRAQTPLLDAVGHGAALLDRRKEPGERCILAIMTDGLENASREYTKETVKALLDRKQKEDGWLVLYLGAGHDAWEQARAMGLHAGNVSAFSKRHIDATMASVASRGRRYAMAAEPEAEAAGGGFTERERAGMAGGDKTVR